MVTSTVELPYSFFASRVEGSVLPAVRRPWQCPRLVTRKLLRILRCLWLPPPLLPPPCTNHLTRPTVLEAHFLLVPGIVSRSLRDVGVMRIKANRRGSPVESWSHLPGTVDPLAPFPCRSALAQRTPSVRLAGLGLGEELLALLSPRCPRDNGSWFYAHPSRRPSPLPPPSKMPLQSLSNPWGGLSVLSPIPFPPSPPWQAVPAIPCLSRPALSEIEGSGQAGSSKAYRCGLYERGVLVSGGGVLSECRRRPKRSLLSRGVFPRRSARDAPWQIAEGLREGTPGGLCPAYPATFTTLPSAVFDIPDSVPTSGLSLWWTRRDPTPSVCPAPSQHRLLHERLLFPCEPGRHPPGKKACAASFPPSTIHLIETPFPPPPPLLIFGGLPSPRLVPRFGVLLPVLQAGSSSLPRTAWSYPVFHGVSDTVGVFLRGIYGRPFPCTHAPPLLGRHAHRTVPRDGLKPRVARVFQWGLGEGVLRVTALDQSRDGGLYFRHVPRLSPSGCPRPLECLRFCSWRI